MKEFDARFKDFSEIGKLSQFLKTSYDVLPDGEWTVVAEKLFNLSKSKLQMVSASSPKYEPRNCSK